MPLTYPAYCKVCDKTSKGRKPITGHRTVSWMKTQCVKCGTIKPVPWKRWVAGLCFLIFIFGLGFYVLYSSLIVLWPLFEMPFIDPDTGWFCAGTGLIPTYWGFAWLIGKAIK